MIHGENKLLADQVGISQQHWSDIKAGRKHPSRPLALRLEAVTGITAAAWMLVAPDCRTPEQLREMLEGRYG